MDNILNELFTLTEAEKERILSIDECSRYLDLITILEINSVSIPFSAKLS